MQKKEICNKENCTGCMACFNACEQSALKMITDEKGFWYPQIDDSLCINCNLCYQACPIQTEQNNTQEYEQKVYAAWNLNEKIRKKSSSGGIFSILANYIIEQNGIVVGAGYDKEFNVIHTCASTQEDYQQMRGSKYVQSYIGTCYKEISEQLKNEKKVLFTGTPCQVDALHHYLEAKNLNKYKESLLCVDLVCHGVPSPLIFSEYKEMLKQKYTSEIDAVQFRDKRISWQNFSMSIHFENGKEESKCLSLSPYYRLFSENIILRDSCYECKYSKQKRVADITLCDFWGYTPKDETEQPYYGVSGIIINTKKGEQVLDKITPYCHLIPQTIHALLPKNPHLLHSSAASPKKAEFWTDYCKHGFSFVYQKYMETGEKIVKSANFFYKNYWLLIKWFEKKQQYGSLEKPLLEKGYQHIAVYGLGEIGRKLIDDLADSAIEIVCSIDKNCTVSYRDIPVVQTIIPEKLDAIIVTPIAEFNAIKKDLSNQTTCPIISLETVVES